MKLKALFDSFCSSRLGKLFSILVVLLLIFRAALPEILKVQINKQLQEISPRLTGSIQDLDLAIWRGAYGLDGLVIGPKDTKGNPPALLEVDALDVSIAWRELLRGRILGDLILEGARFHYNPDLIDDLKNQKSDKTKNNSDVKQMGGQLVVLEIDMVTIKNSDLYFKVLDFPDETPLLSQIEGQATGLKLTGEKNKKEQSYITLKANVLRLAPITAWGNFIPYSKPQDWDFNVELKKLELTKLNFFLKKWLPLTFTTGDLSVVAEVRSKQSEILGYVKPYLQNVDVVGNREEFMSFKHLGVETVTAIANLVFRDAGKKSFLTRVPFRKKPDQKVEFDWAEAIRTTVQHGFNEPQSAMMEESISL